MIREVGPGDNIKQRKRMVKTNKLSNLTKVPPTPTKDYLKEGLN
jgi:hypothetical protein